MKTWRRSGVWLALGIVLLLGVWPIPGQNASLRETSFTILVAIVMAVSLNIIMGYTGYISFGHVVFYGVGGYVGMYVIREWNVHIALAILAGGAGAGLLAFLLGKAILRLRGAYFALVTIGVSEAARTFVANFGPFGASRGIELQFSVYQPYGGAANALWLVYYLVLAITVVAVLFSHWLKHSKLGLALMSIREDEDAAEVMGIVTPDAKTLAFLFSAVLPGMLGVLFYFKNGNVEPGDAFRLQFSIESLVMIMLGGQGTLLGPILGAIGYQQLRSRLVTSSVMIGTLPLKNFQLVIAGSLLLIIILFIPAGFVGWLRRRLPTLGKVLI